MDWLAVLRESLGGSAIVAVPAALMGGVLTGLNPCCLPIYPAAAAACCANRGDGASSVTRLAPSSAVSLALGLASAMTALGFAAALGGRTMSQLGGRWAMALAVVPLLAGAHFLGFIKLPVPSLSSVPRARGVFSAFATGLLLALVFGPCGTPLLASLLSFVAYDGRPIYGALLLFVYGIGIAVPVVLLGATATRLAMRLDRSGKRAWVDRSTGALLVALGLYVLWRA